MRILLSLLIFFIALPPKGKCTTNDSLGIEQIRKEALSLYRSGKLVESIEKIENAIKEAKRAELSERFINQRLQLFLANRYSNIGDFDRAIEIAQYLENFYRQVGDQESELYVKNNLGVYHQNIERHYIAYTYFLDVWQIEQESSDVIDKLDCLDGLAASCIKLGKLKEAEKYLDLAEKLLGNNNFEEKDELLLYYYINKSNLALAIPNEAKAEKFLLKSILLSEKTADRKGADACRLLAGLFLQQGKHQQALKYAQKITSLLGLMTNPSAKDPYLLQSYLIQAKAFLAMNDYDSALSNCEKAEEQALFFQSHYMFDESKLYIGELRRENFETAVMTLYKRYTQSGKTEYLEQALLYADRAKSNVLNERWSNIKILAQEQRKEALSERRKLIFQLSSTNKDSSNLLIGLRNKLDSINDVLGVKKQESFSAEDLKIFRNSLEEDEIFLEYMLIDTLLFRFDIQKNQLAWNSQKLKNPNHIFDFYELIRNPNSTVAEFMQSAQKLPSLLPYQLLENTTVKKINIIPDGLLNYLIFDALPLSKEGNNWNEIQYALTNYSFRYDFSIQSSKQPKVDTAKSNYVGFAPDYSTLNEWATLKNSEKVLQQVGTYFEGETYFGDQATKNKLQKHVPKADLLQIYAHGVSNDSSFNSSYLVLQDEKMYVNEILALPLQTKLCILTACEVGMGKKYRGEGITGIAWSFKAAGSSNVIQSMWKLNEQSSYELMSYFFMHLAEEMNSAEALTEAKRLYLKDPELSNRLKHPYYWAGIGHYGKGAILSKKANTNNWKFPVLAMVSALGFFIAFRFYYNKKIKAS